MGLLPNHQHLLLAMLFGASIFTVGCARDYRAVAPEVLVLRAFPSCAYDKLGAIAASEGRTEDGRQVNEGGAGTVGVWGERVDEDAVVARLREQAAALGANAVVVRSRVSASDSGNTGSVRRRSPDQGLRLRGVAIRIAGEPLSSACDARAWEAPTRD